MCGGDGEGEEPLDYFAYYDQGLVRREKRGRGRGRGGGGRGRGRRGEGEEGNGAKASGKSGKVGGEGEMVIQAALSLQGRDETAPETDHEMVAVDGSLQDSREEQQAQLEVEQTHMSNVGGDTADVAGEQVELLGDAVVGTGGEREGVSVAMVNVEGEGGGSGDGDSEEEEEEEILIGPPMPAGEY